MKSIATYFATTLLLFGLTNIANAATVTYRFEGSVTSVPIELSHIFNTSQNVSGYYTFESTTPDSNPGDSTQSLYPNAISELVFMVGSNTIQLGTETGSSNSISIDLSSDYESYNVNLRYPDAPYLDFDSYKARWFGIHFTDNEGLGNEYFSNDAIAIDTDLLMNLPSRRWQLTYNNESDPNLYVFGTITSISNVPIPGTAWLLGSGLIAIVRIQRKFMKKR